MGYVPEAGMPAANRPSSWQLSSPQPAPRPASGPETQVHDFVLKADEGSSAEKSRGSYPSRFEQDIHVLTASHSRTKKRKASR